MKNERGLTLIELLAVIVILGIISAIAIPAIGKVINNAKADTHLANARQVLDVGRMAYSSGYTPEHDFYGAKSYKVKELVDHGLLEDKIKNPSIFSSWTNPSEVYDLENSIVVVDSRSGSTIFKVNLSAGGSNQLFSEPMERENIKRESMTEEFKRQLGVK